MKRFQIMTIAFPLRDIIISKEAHLLKHCLITFIPESILTIIIGHHWCMQQTVVNSNKINFRSTNINTFFERSQTFMQPKSTILALVNKMLAIELVNDITITSL